MKHVALLILLAAVAAPLNASPWTYQGTLQDSGRPANGQYDLRLSLMDQSGTRSLAEPVTLLAVPVRDGSFSVAVDFGIELKHAPAMLLQTEVAQAGSGFTSIGDPSPFDPKAVLAGLCWDTTGNVVVAGEFLGATNNMPIEIKSNSRRIARFEAVGSANEARVVMGSSANVATGVGATIGGGGSSAATCGSGSASCINTTDETFATIAGGAGNTIVGSHGTISGGISNSISGTFSNIAGGARNVVGFSAAYSAIGGGEGNLASGQYAVVSGGNNNTAAGNWDVTAGGQSNRSENQHSVVGGGSGNLASGSGSSVLGGLFNSATGSRGTVAGGESGTASGTYSFVPGGYFNCAGGHSSFAGGRRAKVRPGTSAGAVGEGCMGVANSGTLTGDAGSFVWADAQDVDFVTSAPNQFIVRADGGFMVNARSLVNPNFDDLVFSPRASGDADLDMIWQTRSGKLLKMFLSDTSGGLFINVPTHDLSSSRLSVSAAGLGAATLSAGGVWTNASSRDYKEDIAPVDPQEILAKVVELPISTWTYKQSYEGAHLGPMAEDFKASFGLAGDGRSIGTVDADGVALAAIQGLHQKLAQAEAENRALKARLDAIEAKLGP